MGKTQKRNNNVSQKKRSPVRTSLKLRKEKKMKGGASITTTLVRAYKAVDKNDSTDFKNIQNESDENTQDELDKEYIEKLTNVTDEQYYTAYDYVKSKTTLNKDIVISPFQYAIIKGRSDLIETVIKDVNTINLKKTASYIRQFRLSQKEISFKNTDSYSLIFTQGYYLDSNEEIQRLIDSKDTVKKEVMQKIVELFNKKNDLMNGGADDDLNKMPDDKLNKLLESISNGNMKEVFEQIGHYITKYIGLAEYFQGPSQAQLTSTTASNDIGEQDISAEQQLTLTSSNIEDTGKEMNIIIQNLQTTNRPLIGKQISNLIKTLKLQRELYSKYEDKDDENKDDEKSIIIQVISNLMTIFYTIREKEFPGEESSDDKTNLQKIIDIVNEVNEKFVNHLPKVVLKDNKLHFQNESEGLYIPDQSLITTPIKNDNSSEPKQIEDVNPDPIDGNSLVNSSNDDRNSLVNSSNDDSNSLVNSSNDDRTTTRKNIKLSNDEATTFQFVFYENRNSEAIQTVSILLSIDNGKIKVEADENEAGTGENVDEASDTGSVVEAERESGNESKTAEGKSADGSEDESEKESGDPTVVNPAVVNQGVDSADANQNEAGSEDASKKAGGAPAQVLGFILAHEYILNFYIGNEKKFTYNITFQDDESQGDNKIEYSGRPAVITGPKNEGSVNESSEDVNEGSDNESSEDESSDNEGSVNESSVNEGNEARNAVFEPSLNNP